MGSSVSVGVQPSTPLSGGVVSQPQSRRASQFNLSIGSTHKLKKSKSTDPNASKRNSIAPQTTIVSPVLEFTEQSSSSSSSVEDIVHNTMESRTLKSPPQPRMKTFPSALLRNDHAKSSPRVLIHASTSKDDMQMTDAEDEDDTNGRAVIYRNQHEPEEAQDIMPP
ncbi:hypothetical protein C9374_010460 [Naegleria lovaniensis]|uniref:Uncharacterized protein n=1 Tax=Naegleria lovaniensis TaxID=51637 RepID=A0AA88GIE3_NAELO|nr:uncharacterized protein C9374_010460 [Naegleria lovaniensis]KAG2374716.1 hypothetical protein C9374_010460 [Naegleria lovaniensis]